MLFVSVRLIRLPEEKKGKKYFGANKEYGRKNIPRKRKSKSMEKLNAGEAIKTRRYGSAI